MVTARRAQAIGKLQRMALGRMYRHGGIWHPLCGWNLHYGAWRTNEVMKTLLWRGLVCVVVHVHNDAPYSEYKLTEEGRKMAQERELDPVQPIDWEALDPLMMNFEVHVAKLGEKMVMEGDQLAVVGLNLPWTHGVVAMTGSMGGEDEIFSAKCAFLFAAAPKLFRALHNILNMPHDSSPKSTEQRSRAFKDAAEALHLAAGGMHGLSPENDDGQPE
jgi:hypothetical protein